MSTVKEAGRETVAYVAYGLTSRTVERNAIADPTGAPETAER